MDDAVADLRRELTALDIDARAIDELVDHFVSTIDARLALGESPEQAAAAARACLGDLAAIAREHAKVALPFGPRPSLAVAWATAVAMLAWPVLIAAGAAELSLFLLGWGAIRVLAIGGLVGRSPQATAVVHGIACAELLVLVVYDALSRTACLAISAGVLIVFAGRSTPLRWAMFALGCMVPLHVIGFSGPLRDIAAFAWLAAAAALAVRARLAPVPCSVLAVLVAYESYTSIAYVHSLGHRIGFAQWHVLDIAASLAVACAGTAVALISTRCDRPLRTILAAVRARRV